MPLCTFTINNIEFTCSYGDGLIIPLKWVQRAGLYNMEYLRALEIAFEATQGLHILLGITQVNSSSSQRLYCSQEEFEQLNELYRLVQEFDVIIQNDELEALLNKAHEQYSNRQPPQKHQKPSIPHGTGYVYLLNEINGAHYKIGHTKNPKDRLRTFAVKLPYRVEFDVLIPTDNMQALEAQLHSHFADKRIDGEWFALEPADIAYIKSLAGAL